MKLTAALTLLPCALLTWRCDAPAWNIPGHMLSGAIAYQILQRESPATIPAVRLVLEKHPWYESHWRGQLEKLPEPERDETLFKLAARWADDIRRRDPAENRPLWHFINWPFKPEGEPEASKQNRQRKKTLSRQ
jgi:hypothetical protein